MVEEPIQDKAAQPEGTRSLTTDIAIVVAGGANGTANALVTNLLNRPPKEEPPTVVLPPGVPKE